MELLQCGWGAAGTLLRGLPRERVLGKPGLQEPRKAPFDPGSPSPALPHLDTAPPTEQATRWQGEADDSGLVCSARGKAALSPADPFLVESPSL